MNFTSNIHSQEAKIYEFRKITINDDTTLNKDEQIDAIRILSKRYDYDKIINNEGKTRICESCKKQHYFASIVLRSYLEAKFSEWTSGNDDIDNLIKKCQLESTGPNKIIEWIPYNNLENMKYLTEERHGSEKVIVKRLENVKNANRSWFDEAKLHLTISNKWVGIVQSFGPTQDPSDESYDLGFCGPPDKPIKSIYGNLPYIAPEVINGKEYTYASDIYSIGMLMWEISSGRPPFSNFENDYFLVTRIFNGMRPNIIPNTPSGYKEIMIQCWDADPLKRPNINILHETIMNLYKSSIINDSGDDKNSKKYLSFIPFMFTSSSSKTSRKTNYTSYRTSMSKIYQFMNLPEPKNATEVEQEAFHSKPYDFNVASDIIKYGGNSKNNTSKDNTSSSENT
ncbi:kinase-like domain-containing protein [Rhizophagus clarus]|uniref:Kinase-like domain-containing protein n=1 Tax=Rhizophagus clarus TaxID=94130 RepID=A0A8H3LCH2_9GLOM|nr:kinase-like domain-containing protein [Rhizophagus clarus]